MTHSIIKHQKIQITDIRSLIQDTHTAEIELREHCTRARSSAEKLHKDTLEENTSSAVEKRETTRLNKDTNLEQLAQRRTLEPTLLKERHDKRISEINYHAQDIKEETETKLNEATWLAESVYDGAMTKLNEIATEAHDALLESKKELDLLCEEAPKALSRLRQSEHVEGVAHESEIDKPMAEYVAAAAKAIQAIQTDKRALWFVGLKPLYIVLFVTAVAVFAAGGYTNWEKTFVFFLIPVLAMCVAIGTLALTYASGKNSIRKRIEQFTQHVNQASLAFSTGETSINQIKQENKKGVGLN
jgi:hypothetical protein